jgi:hypothetical protein
MALQLKARSEYYLLHKLKDEVSMLSSQVKDLYEKQLRKADTNRKVIREVKELGYKYKDELDTEKAKMLSIIEQQKDDLKTITKTVTRLEHFLNLLIHMEQVSLAIHTGIKQDDLSDMVDPHSMPLEKFKNEVEHLKILSSSFDVLRVELAKQTEYVAAFDLSPDTMDEHCFYESEKYENKLAEEEIVSISQLRDFCTDLDTMIHDRLESKSGFASEGDKAAQKVDEELGRIKLSQGLMFSVSFDRFIRRLVHENVRPGHQSELIVFLLLFLLSRMKKFRMNAYYSSLRASIFVHSLASHFERRQRDAVTGAALMANFTELDFPVESLAGDEQQIVRNYYLTANQVFDEDFTFVTRVIAEYRKPGEDAPLLPWITEGASLIRLAYDFDALLEKQHYNFGLVAQMNDSIKKQLMEKHGSHELQIDHLLSGWQRMIPRETALLA